MSISTRTAAALLLGTTALTVQACASRSDHEVASVQPDFETTPVASRDDAADDPAILISADGSLVRILGTDKQAGLAVYGLDGEQHAFLASGRVNNVDAVALGEDQFLAAASNRTEISIDLYTADLSTDTYALAARQPLQMEEPYGLCMVRAPAVSIFVGDKEGKVEQWAVADDLATELVRTFQFDSQTEGCVVDPTGDTLYVGEEMRGIWAVDLSTGERRLIEEAGDGFLVPDVEGLDIFTRGTEKFLIASSQGDNSYLIYRLPEGQRLLKFRIDDDPASGIDGTTETDGLAVTVRALPGYPRGLLVVQDGHNGREPQNFKGVDWRQIEALLP